MDMLPLRSGPPRQATTLHHWSCRSVGLLLYWRCHTVAISLADVGTPQASFTQNRQERLLRSNLFTSGTDFGAFRAQGSICCNARTVLASHPNNQGMDTLRLGGLHCKVSETSRKASLSS